MALRDIFKISRKTFFNPAGWIGYESLKLQNLTIWAILKNLFSKPRPLFEETFEQAMQRLGIAEEDCKKAAIQYRIFAIFFLMLGCIVFCYAFYLLFSHKIFLGWMLGIASSTLFFAQAFKYDFWSLQIRRHQLGLTFQDWKMSLFGKKGSTP